jgi:hypothetical protein
MLERLPTGKTFSDHAQAFESQQFPEDPLYLEQGDRLQDLQFQKSGHSNLDPFLLNPAQTLSSLVAKINQQLGVSTSGILRSLSTLFGAKKPRTKV